MQHARFLIVLAVLITVLVSLPFAAQARTIGGWSPIYEGVWAATGSDTVPQLMYVYAIRVDLHNPNVVFFATPKTAPDPNHTYLQQTAAFLSQYGCKVAINTNFFNSSINPTVLIGAEVSNGVVVAPGNSTCPGQMRITQDNAASIVYTTSTPSGFWTVSGGYQALLTNGSRSTDTSSVAPRSCCGISQDGRYLYLIVCDGRQAGYSDGATLHDMADWLADFGAYNGMNFDGGGSSTLVRADTGTWNSPSMVPDRSVGANLGVKSVGYYGKSQPCVGNNANGQIAVFARGREDAIYYATTVSGSWSSWTSLDDLYKFKGNPVVISNEDGTMQLFCVGIDGALWTMCQDSPDGGFTGTWQNLGNNGSGWPSKPAVARDANDCIWVFIRGTDNAIYYKNQNSANGSFSTTWQALNANQDKAGPAAITDNNGYIHVFAVGTGGTMVEDKQLPGGGWSGWTGIGGPWNHGPVVAKNEDGRLEVFVIGNDGKMNHKWQNSDGTWAANWSNDLGGTWTHDPIAFPDQNGALQVFCVGSTGNLYTKYQTAPNSGWYGSWVNLGGTWSADPGIGMNADGRDELFIVGNDPYMYHSWESAPNGPFGGWSSLGPNTIF